MEYTHSVHFHNFYRSYSIHTSQYSPSRSQFYHLFPWKSHAIIPPRWSEANSQWPNESATNSKGGIAMKKITMKQLLVNAMEVCGTDRILSERYWSLNKALSRPYYRKKPHWNLEVTKWRTTWWRTWSVPCRRSARCVASSASNPANQMIMKGLPTVRRPSPNPLFALGGM